MQKRPGLWYYSANTTTASIFSFYKDVSNNRIYLIRNFLSLSDPQCNKAIGWAQMAIFVVNTPVLYSGFFGILHDIFETWYNQTILQIHFAKVISIWILAFLTQCDVIATWTWSECANRFLFHISVWSISYISFIHYYNPPCETALTYVNDYIHEEFVELRDLWWLCDFLALINVFRSSVFQVISEAVKDYSKYILITRSL